MAESKDLTGQKFGRLTVIKFCETKKGKGRMWLCRCDCGRSKVVSTGSLTTLHTKSCGCLHDDLSRERLTKLNKSRAKHGESNTRLYEIWIGIVKRCYNKKFWAYNRYGGRGIVMDKDWKCDFLKFKEWALKNGYEEHLTIDRIDNNKGYYPENCRWVDMKTQGNNKCNNRYITYKGETHTVAEWSRITGIKYGTLINRLNYGIPIDEVLSTKKYLIGKRKTKNAS